MQKPQSQASTFHQAHFKDDLKPPRGTVSGSPDRLTSCATPGILGRARVWENNRIIAAQSTPGHLEITVIPVFLTDCMPKGAGLGLPQSPLCPQQ